MGGGGWGEGVLDIMHGRSRMAISRPSHASSNLLVALVVSRLTTQPFGDGARPLLLIEALPTCGRSKRFFPGARGVFGWGGGCVENG